MALASLDAVLASPLGDSGGFRTYSYTPDWSAPAGERDALDQAAMLHLLLEAGQPRYAESVRALLGFVEGTLFDKAEGVFRGRQVMAIPSASSATTWWTDPALYADRQAALIRAYLAGATTLGDERAAQVALQAGDVLLNRCIDGRGRVQHVCDSEAEGSAGLLADQALAALALWELGQWSGEARFATAAEQVTRFMEQSYDRPAALEPLSHHGKALALQFYGRLSAELKSKQGHAERVVALAAEPPLAQASGRAHSAWARALLLYGPPL